MARSKGSFGLAGAVEPKAAAPLDARAVVKNMGELTAVGSFPYPYIGMETYVVSENKKYRLIGNDPTVSSNWEEVGAGETGGGHEIQSGGTALAQEDALNFIGFDVEDNDTDGSTDVSEHELTTSELTEIMSTLPGQPTQGITIDLRGNEQVIGKVIKSDGTEKTLYQKTINFGALPNAAGKSVAHNVSGLYKLISAKANWVTSGPYYGDLSIMSSDGNSPINFWMDASTLTIWTMKDYSSYSAYITIQYTKTT